MNVLGGRELKNDAKLFAIKNYLGLLHASNMQYPLNVIHTTFINYPDM